MIYPYKCPLCKSEFEVIKSVKDIDNLEECPSCDTISNREISRFQAIDKTAAADWNNKEWNPALGKAVTPIEAKKEAKRKGLIEMGNECPDKAEKHFADQRAKKMEYKL
jgi:putative FmdB family regulatory protein